MQDRGSLECVPAKGRSLVPLTGAVALVLCSCAAPTVTYFGPPPSGQREIGAMRDTVRIRRLDADSLAVDGVFFAEYVRRRAVAADAISEAQRLDVLLRSLPEGNGVDLPADYAPDADLVLRLAGQGPDRMMDLARADALVVTGVEVDTLDFVVTVPDPTGSDTTVTSRWMVMLLTAAAWLDPAVGLRPDPDATQPGGR